MTDDETLGRLEFPRVRELLAERTAFGPSRELAEDLAPVAERGHAERLQDETEAARRALRDRPSLSIGGARDIRPHIRRAGLGGVLDPSELLEVSITVRAAQKLFAGVDDPAYAPLHARARFARPPLDVADEIDHAIAPSGEILDRASARLAELRAELRLATARLQQRLDALVRAPEVARFLQEPIVTQRNGRYVLPVKAEHRGQVRGVVHDQSASGQTLFVEPLEILDLGNRVREIGLAEQREIERILTALTSRVGRESAELDRVLAAVAAIDLILAKAQLADSMEADRPTLGDDGVLDLIDARHPLIGPAVVPISVRLGGDHRVLVITGPNTGGKTVTLKTIGLLATMAAAGLQLPASRQSRLPVFRRIFADIGDEQSIQQSLSTFSSHLRNVVATLREAQPGDLALLDEIGAGTDPDEGAALAMSILSTLLRREVLAAATTHYPELKAFALTTSGVRNASVEFDTDSLQPTYRLHIGLPGASQAFAIAARLGLDGAVLEEAKGHLSELHRSLEQTLRQAERQRTELAEARERLEAEIGRAAADRHAAQAEAERLRAEARAELERARAEAEEVLLAARRAVRAAEEANARASRLSLIEEARAALAAAEAALPASDVPPATAPGDLLPGAAVLVGASAQPARLIRIDERGIAEVEAGSARLRVPATALRVARPDAPEVAPPATVRHSARDVPLQLDLRGARAEDALAVLDRYLNDAALSGYDRVRVVHGKGTGALRQAVRSFLGAHPLVKEQRSAQPSEGGDGATIVVL